jgi:hypothetical protein
MIKKNVMTYAYNIKLYMTYFLWSYVEIGYIAFQKVDFR